jgi:hypothetical protein
VLRSSRIKLYQTPHSSIYGLHIARYSSTELDREPSIELFASQLRSAWISTSPRPIPLRGRRTEPQKADNSGPENSHQHSLAIFIDYIYNIIQLYTDYTGIYTSYIHHIMCSTGSWRTVDGQVPADAQAALARAVRT